MSDADRAPSSHSLLDFNAPLSDEHAGALVETLRPLTGAKVVDLGCGWGELLLRLLEAEPTASGIGLDTDGEAIARGRFNASLRNLSGRARLEIGDATEWKGSADAVVAIGVSHAWGGTRKMLQAIRDQLGVRGRLLLGEGFWERPPTDRSLAALGVEPGDFGSLAELVDLAMQDGFRLLSLSVAGAGEWDAFESNWCAGRERWLIEHPESREAQSVRAIVDEHRDGWLHGYRGVLGFAYLTLVLAPPHGATHSRVVAPG